MDGIVNISKSMVITGDIITSDDLAIEGNVIGNITYEKDLELHGTVEGNVTATGDFNGTLNLNKGAVVLGDIYGKEVTVSGAAKGTVAAQKHLDVKSTAIIQGDLKGATIQIDNGSAIEGMLKINPSNMDVAKVFEI